MIFIFLKCKVVFCPFTDLRYMWYHHLWLTEFLWYLNLSDSSAFGINSILYQRGIYPPETFSRVTHYNMSLQLSTDPKLKNYLTNVVSQLKGLSQETVQPVNFLILLSVLECET